MEVAKLPTSPFILAFILSKSLEEYFRKGVSYADGDYTMFFTRPISLMFILIAVISIAWPTIKKMRANKRQQALA